MKEGNIITVKSFADWKLTTENVFASCNGTKIGITAYGENFVSNNGVKFVFASKSKAIDKYNEVIKEALGIEVEPKEGEVWYVSGVMVNDAIFRSSDSLKNKCENYSALELNGGFHTSGTYINDREIINLRKATPKEEYELINNGEHANGYHWDGRGLVKIPEYVECIEPSQFKNTIRDNGGLIFNADHINGHITNFPSSFKPSTKEAYEAQEAKKNVSFSADDVLKVSDAFRIESSKLRGRLSKNSDRIKELEISNNELNVEIETKDKRIAELEKNLIIMCELGNKALA